jgi:hypothetical protein
MGHYLKVAGIVILVVAVVFRVQALRTAITGLA